MAWLVQSPLGLPTWCAAALVAMAVASAVVDLRKGLVPNWLTYSAVLVGLAGHALAGGVVGTDNDMGLAGSLAGLAVGFVPMMLVWLAGGIGGGDAKLMGAIGSIGGWLVAVDALFLGCLAAAVMAIWVMIRRKVVRQTLRRVFHAAALLFGGVRPADPTTPESPRIPFAVALCVGVLGAVGKLAWYAIMHGGRPLG